MHQTSFGGISCFKVQFKWNFWQFLTLCAVWDKACLCCWEGSSVRISGEVKKKRFPEKYPHSQEKYQEPDCHMEVQSDTIRYLKKFPLLKIEVD